MNMIGEEHKARQKKHGCKVKERAMRLEEYKQAVLALKSSDLVLLYTDGLADAVNFNGERYGSKRIKETFAKGGESADVVAQNILWDMRKFVGLTKRADDVTMIVVKVE